MKQVNPWTKKITLGGHSEKSHKCIISGCDRNGVFEHGTSYPKAYTCETHLGSIDCGTKPRVSKESATRFFPEMLREGFRPC